MWPEETDTSFPHDTIRFLKHGKDEFNLSGKSESDYRLRKEFKLHLSDVNQVGRFPVPGPESREQPIYYYVMNEKNCLTTVHGLTHPIRVRFYVSNDLLHVGEYYVPTGGVGARTSEPIEHGGDAALYCMSGPATVFLPDTDETFHVQPTEVLYVPPNHRYRFINYNDRPLSLYFAVSRDF